ncbi:MAG: F0F1 ATP synthase subunit delta, partial [Muribaculaceae bacterium]|nr:F0F1 ATP synthase subunit delta [Muribaculaceae bacterium]
IHYMMEKHLPDGATDEISLDVDSALIGGFTVAVDNERLDASVANELKQLRLKLLSN